MDRNPERDTPGKAAHAGLPSTERDRAQPEQGLSYSQKQQLSAQVTAQCPSAVSFSVAGKRQNRLLNPQSNTCKEKLSMSVIGKGQEKTTILKHNMGSADAQMLRAPLCPSWAADPQSTNVS